MGSGASARSGNRRPVTSGTYGERSPGVVPQLAAGYWWRAVDATGLGTSGFTVPEGGGHTTFDLVQATTTRQPTALAESGGVQYRMRRAADANPSIIAPAAAVQAGWTGATYIAGWFRLPDASGDVTGYGNLFTHTPSTAGQRRVSFGVVVASGDKFSVTTSNDGTAAVNHQWLSNFTGGWRWIELFITPGTGVELYVDFALVTATLAHTPGSPLFDGSATISLACRAAASLANADTTDWAAVYYGNGLPSLGDREALFRAVAPV